ncbi:hypothetical protein [Paenibacillus sp. MMO-177]|uniref:hypothetical protein n=1 Tax=Paenibacillus sp. MMO-177 TaxID=3081289 RepID=UPI00301937C5
MQAEAIREPRRWAYMKLLHGKHVNPLHLMSMLQREQEKRQWELIRRMCKATGSVAVGARLLTRRQREKYAANRVREGNHTFYLFDRKYCPADIGIRIDLQSQEDVQL